MKLTVTPISNDQITFEDVSSYHFLKNFLVMSKGTEDDLVLYNVDEIEFFRVEPDDED